MKRYFILILIVSFISQLHLNAQWTFNTKGHQYASNNGLTANTKGVMTVISSGGGVNSTTTPEGLVLTNTGMLRSGNNYDIPALNSGVASALSSVPLDKWFKTKTGKSETIQLNYQYNKTSPANNSANPTQTNTFTANYKVVVGSNESHSTYQNFTTVPTQVTETQSGNTVTGTLQATVNFPVGSTKGYVVIPVVEEITNFSLFCNRNLPPTCYWTENSVSNVIILPFIVEGASIDLSAPDAVGIAGYTKEPAIPYMILHAPPGDNSSVTFEQTQETCRSFSETVQDDFSASGKLDITLGIAGSAGLFVTTDFEFAFTASITGGGGNTNIKKADDKTCISALSSMTTLTKASGVEDGTIYMGFSSDLAYGFFPRVIIESDNPLVIKKDTALIFGTVGSPVPFYWTKKQIISDIRTKQAIVDAYVPTNPINEQALSLANHALNQIKVWNQVLAKDSANRVNPQNDVINASYTISSDLTITETISYSRSTVYDVSRYISAGAGASFVVKVAGSGISGGAEFSTKKTFGQGVSNTSNSTSTIKYRLYDDDYQANGGKDEIIKMKIVRDPDYGTPIFLLDSAFSRTSAPYEGGYQRDQPLLRFSTAPNDVRYTVPNVAVGTTSQFGVRVCNNSDEPRTYNLKFDPFTNANNVLVSLTGSTGTTEFGAFPVPANSCLPNTYFVNINQQNAEALTSQEINLQLYTSQEPKIISDIFVTSNWGNYALPSNLLSSNALICSGLPVNLSAFCPAGVATWYNTETGGTALGTGSTITQTPLTNTDYYVACQAGIFNYPRVKASSVLVPTTISPSLNLTANLTANSVRLANTSLLASNKIFSPAKVAYLAGKSLTFTPGFEVKSGSSFEAKIGGCANLTINGLVAYYPFNGNANDESGNGNNGVVNGSTLTTDRFGNAGQAYGFDGIDDMIQVAASEDLNTITKATISFWANHNQVTRTTDAFDWQAYISKDTPGKWFTTMLCTDPAGCNGERPLILYTPGLSKTDSRYNWSTVSPDVWYYITLSNDGVTSKFYLNGALVYSENVTGSITTNTSDLILGRCLTGSLYPLDGKLDDVRIYNRALSDGEVQALYTAEKP